MEFTAKQARENYIGNLTEDEQNTFDLIIENIIEASKSKTNYSHEFNKPGNVESAIKLKMLLEERGFIVDILKLAHNDDVTMMINW